MPSTARWRTRGAMTTDQSSAETQLTFALPDLGEGLTEAEIVRWLVKVGDVVTVNQPLVEVETAKAVVEIPSPHAGTIAARHGEDGATVSVGAPLVTYLTTGGTESVGADDEAELGPVNEAGDKVGDAAADGVVGEDVGGDDSGGPLLVGYGVTHGSTHRRARRAASPHGTDRREAGPPGEPVKPVRHGGLEVGRAAEARFASDANPSVRAKPPVRKLARDLGVTLSDVRPTGPDETVTRDDVEAAAALLSPASREPGTVAGFAEGERESVRGVAKAMSQAMVRSAFSIPQVTVWLDADVTASKRLLQRLKQSSSFDGAAATPLLLVARACLSALKRQPLLNGTYDAATDEIVHRSTVNLGVAAATSRGLLVPSLKDAGSLSFADLAAGLLAMTQRTRDGQATPGELTGGTFTITNVGVFGVDGGTPLINPGESAILAVGAWRERPWVVDGELVVRTVATLAITFDHRFIDGATGSRFLRDVADLLEEPAADLAW